MHATTTSNWYETNYVYLNAAVNQVRQTLQNYIALIQNQSVDKLSEIESSLDAAAVSLSAPSRLEHLCNIFNLSAFDRRLLLLCVGMEIHPDFEALCAKAQRNEKRLYPTFALALEIFPHPDWNAIAPDAPLRRWQLLELGEGKILTKRALFIDECILHYLMGVPYQDSHLASFIKSSSLELSGNTPLQPSYEAIARALAATWFQIPNILEKPTIQLCSSSVANSQAIAAATCSTNGLNLKVQTRGISSTV